MTPLNQSQPARPAFRLLAGILTLLFLAGVGLSVSFALDGTLSKLQRWGQASSAAVFLFMTPAFGYVAFTGRWFRKLCSA
jgi:hypothetical protein